MNDPVRAKLAALIEAGLVRPPTSKVRRRPVPARVGWVRQRAGGCASGAITYVDISTLIKLLLDEIDTAEAGQIWDEADVLVSARIAHVEARAALHAARRHRLIPADVLRDATEGLEVLWSQMAVVEIDEHLMRLAGEVAAEHGLRGCDAVHLAAHLVGARCSSAPIAACARPQVRPDSTSPIGLRSICVMGVLHVGAMLSCRGWPRTRG